MNSFIFAQNLINPATELIGDISPAEFLSGIFPAILSLILVVGIIAFLVYFLIGGVEWITSGGDKAKTEKARSKLTQALTGLILLLSFLAIVLLVERFFGISLRQFEIGPFHVGFRPPPTLAPTGGPEPTLPPPTVLPPSTATPSTPPPPGCGNGTIDPGEACDDGNLVSGDGCRYDCLRGCYDSDGGPVAEVAGRVTVYHPDGAYTYSDDSCYSTVLLHEYVCTQVDDIGAVWLDCDNCPIPGTRCVDSP